MIHVYPQLRETKVAFVWGGTLDFAFDIMPHAGRMDGMYFSLGYAGHGVAMATLLGKKIAESILMQGGNIGRSVRLKRVICDKFVTIEDGTVIGEDLAEDAKRFHVSPGGIVVIPKGAIVPLNVVTTVAPPATGAHGARGKLRTRR